MLNDIMKYVYPAVLGLLAILFLSWLMIRHQAQKVIAAMMQIDLPRLPELAQKLSDYIQTVYRVDLTSMSLDDQVRYISGSLDKLPKGNYRTHFPQGKIQLYCSVIAFLGEVLRKCHHGNWVRQDAEDIPIIRIELDEERNVFCNPALGVIFQIVHGDNSRAVVQIMRPLCKRESLILQYEKLAEAYQVDGNNITLELNDAALPVGFGKMIYVYALLPLLLVCGIGGLQIRDSFNWQVLFGVSLLISAALFLYFKRINGITSLKGYRRMTVYSDKLVFEGNSLSNIILDMKEVICCHQAKKRYQFGQIKLLHIMDSRRHILLKEIYFINPGEKRDILEEIAKRIEEAKKESQS